MKLHTGDTVVVVAGKDKGKTGRVLRVLPTKNRVVVAGVNMRTRHMRKTQQAPGRVVRYEAALDRSNVMIVDPKTKKRSRLGFQIKDGKKERIAKKSGEALASGKKLKSLVEEELKKEKGEGAKDQGLGTKDKNKKKDPNSHS